MISHTSPVVITPFKKTGHPQTPLMRVSKNDIIRLPNGELMVDPHGHKKQVEKWYTNLTKSGEIDYSYYYPQVSQKASELMIRYILDLRVGKNMAKGTKRGPRAHQSVNAYITRLPKLIERMEKVCKKELLEFTEDDALLFFNGMRDGIILSNLGKPYTDSRTYVKKFAAFWRWYMRILKSEEGKLIPDICGSIDTANHKKPPWNYLSLDDIKRMLNYSPNIFYSALLLFLFDSGIRAPKELMNVRVMDISPIVGTKNLHLQIRNETSKTFGRKIKLMLCATQLMTYIKESGKKGDDFIFDRTYAVMTQGLKRMAFKALGMGSLVKEKSGKYRVKGGISMYDMRHSSVCHYLPLYNSENQMKYRYGWKEADMIHYYSEFMGMKDTIQDTDMLTDTTKTELETQLEKERQKVVLLEEKMMSQTKMMEEKMKRLETMMLQKFANEM